MRSTLPRFAAHAGFAAALSLSAAAPALADGFKLSDRKSVV